MVEKIQTLHPDPGKKGGDYHLGMEKPVSRTILEAPGKRGRLAFRELRQTVESMLAEGFDRSFSSNVTSGKLDQEARGIVKREGRKPALGDARRFPI
jgi:hypothetical protein